jgi:hypothetical protein
LVAIFKNEGHILKEWLEHYINQDVDMFFLIDNGSNDNYIDTIQPYINSNKVTLVKDDTKYQQVYLYNKYYLDKVKSYNWVILCDLDEFIYARRGFPTINSYLKKLPNNVSQVCIPWKMFGSNGYNTKNKRQPTSVINNFTKRASYNEKADSKKWKKEWGEGQVKTKLVKINNIIFKKNEKYNFVKSIARTRDLINLEVHKHNVMRDSICSNQRKDIISGDFCKTNRTILQNSCLHLNHYAIQSINWFMKIKATRGCVAHDINSIHYTNRNEKYYRRYDKHSNNVVDYELLRITMRKNLLSNINKDNIPEYDLNDNIEEENIIIESDDILELDNSIEEEEDILEVDDSIEEEEDILEVDDSPEVDEIL